MKAPKLKPCPFCGHSGVVEAPRPGGPPGAYKSVECKTCWAVGPQMLTVEVAISRWNRRPSKTARGRR